MKVLILGGTVFLGRHTVEVALARGHEVTLFNRGQHNPELFPDVEKLRGHRAGDLSALRDRMWDAAVDTCGYMPRIVRASAELLAQAVERYVFISSISVYRELDKAPGLDENSPVGKLEDETVEEITGESYGPLKALCEQAAEQALPGRALNIRPGLIVGPNDPTDRFTYWPVRVAQGGGVLAPGGPNWRTQVLLYDDPAQRQVIGDAVDDTVVTTITFDGGVPVAVDGPGTSDSSTTFVGEGINPSVVTDPNQNVTTRQWAGGSNLAGVTDALGNSTTMTYDALNQVTETTDDFGRKTVYTYSGTLLTAMTANYVNGIYDPAFPDEDLTTTYTYTTPADTPEPPNLLRAQTDPRGIITRTTYTAQGQRESVTANYVNGIYAPAFPDEDLTASYTYDPQGRMLTMTDPISRVTKNDYDAAGNLTKVTRNYVNGVFDPAFPHEDLFTSYGYDSAGRLTKTTDVLGRADWTCYDTAGRVVKTIQNASVADPCVSYTPSADPAFDRISTTTYDGDSNVIATTGPDGVIIRTYYDTLNRPVTVAQNLTGQTITDPTPPTFNPANPDQNIRADTTYDAAGNVTQMTDNTGRISYACYDALNRAVKTIQNPTVLPPTGNPCNAYTPQPRPG